MPEKDSSERNDFDRRLEHEASAADSAMPVRLYGAPLGSRGQASSRLVEVVDELNRQIASAHGVDWVTGMRRSVTRCEEYGAIVGAGFRYDRGCASMRDSARG